MIIQLSRIHRIVIGIAVQVNLIESVFFLFSFFFLVITFFYFFFFSILLFFFSFFLRSINRKVAHDGENVNSDRVTDHFPRSAWIPIFRTFAPGKWREIKRKNFRISSLGIELALSVFSGVTELSPCERDACDGCRSHNFSHA